MQSVLALGPYVDPQELLAWGLAHAPEVKTQEPRGVVCQDENDLLIEITDDVIKRVRARLEGVPESVEEKTLSKPYKAVQAIARAGVVHPSQILQLFKSEYNPRCRHADGRPFPWSDHRIRKTIRYSRDVAQEQQKHLVGLARQRVLKRTIRIAPSVGGVLSTREAMELYDVSRDVVRRLNPVGKNGRQNVYDANEVRKVAAPETVGRLAAKERKQRIEDNDRSDDLVGCGIEGLDDCIFDADTVAGLMLDMGRGVFALRASMGSGKSEAVVRLLKKYEDSVLSISPKRKQALELGARFGLASYMDGDKVREPDDLRAKSKLSICLQSIPKLGKKTYSLLVLDEIEELLKDIDGALSEPRLVALFDQLKRMLKSADRILVIDAGLKRSTIHQIAEIAGKEVIGCVDRLDYKTRVLSVYERAGVLSWFKELHEALERGPVAVATNSRKVCWLLGEYLRQYDPLVVSAEHPPPPGNLRDAVAGRRLVVWSPTITSGVSLDGLNVDSKYELFGYFVDPDPQEMYQSLGRIRQLRDPLVRLFLVEGDEEPATLGGEGELVDLINVARARAHHWVEFDERSTPCSPRPAPGTTSSSTSRT